LETLGDHPPPPPSYQPRLWPRRRKAKCKGILRTSRKRRNRLEDSVFGLSPPRRAGATPCFPLPEAEFVWLIVSISNANWGRPAHCSVLSAERCTRNGVAPRCRRMYQLAWWKGVHVIWIPKRGLLMFPNDYVKGCRKSYFWWMVAVSWTAEIVFFTKK
jgi:hypothetical protein